MSEDLQAGIDRHYAEIVEQERLAWSRVRRSQAQRWRRMSEQLRLLAALRQVEEG